MWSVGCIFAELMLRVPYLAGESDMDQLKTIFRALGTPTEEDWPVRLRHPPEDLYSDDIFLGAHKVTRLRPSWPVPETTTTRLVHRCDRRRTESPGSVSNLRS